VTVGVVSCAILGAALCLVLGCDQHKSQNAAGEPGASGAVGPKAMSTGRDDHPVEEPGTGGKPSSATASLSSEARERLTTVRVSARVGSTIIRREAADWVVDGATRCVVPAEMMSRALDNLANVRSIPTDEPMPEGTSFELQIVALIDQQRALHFEVADRNESGDFVRLWDDSKLRMQGLDRALWSPHPSAWCQGP
jgi:hypothetical protein